MIVYETQTYLQTIDSNGKMHTLSKNTSIIYVGQHSVLFFRVVYLCLSNNCHICSVSTRGGQIPSTNLALQSPCNTNCSCSRKRFSPVCGSDSVTYADACRAGCRVKLSNMVRYFQCLLIYE